MSLFALFILLLPCPAEVAEPSLEVIAEVAETAEAQTEYRCQVDDINKLVLQRMHPYAAAQVAALICDIPKNGRAVIQLHSPSEFAVKYRVLRGDPNLVHFLGEVRNGMRATRWAIGVGRPRSEPTAEFVTAVERYLAVEEHVTPAQETELAKMTDSVGLVIRTIIHAAKDHEIELSDANENSVHFTVTSGDAAQVQRIARVLGLSVIDDRFVANIGS